MPVGRSDEERLVADMIELTRQYGRYGYRRIAALLRDAGWHVNDKRVERLWRREGLKVPMKQPKKGRLWLNDGSCVRLRPECRNHVWSYDFVHCRTGEWAKPGGQATVLRYALVNLPSRTAARTIATRWAPLGDHLMRRRFPMRVLPMSSTQPSARDEEIGRPLRYRLP